MKNADNLLNTKYIFYYSLSLKANRIKMSCLLKQDNDFSALIRMLKLISLLFKYLKLYTSNILTI